MSGAERVYLADGEALQGLIPGVDPTPHQARQLAWLEAERARRRGCAPPPAGGLFDDVARAQMSLI